MAEISEREPSCAERIDARLASRADDVRKMLAVQGGDTVCKHCGQVINSDGTDVWPWTHDATGDEDCATPENITTVAQILGTRAEPDEDYTEDSLNEFGLGLSRKVVLRFDMSTGGPADWLEIECDEEHHKSTYGGASGPERSSEWVQLEVERVTYHFADWFDHAEQVVDEDSPLYALAEWIAET